MQNFMGLFQCPGTLVSSFFELLLYIPERKNVKVDLSEMFTSVLYSPYKFIGNFST